MINVLACRQHNRVARMRDVMPTAKHSTAALMSILVPVGLLALQVCSLNCSINFCSLSRARFTASETRQSSQCHHQNSGSQDKPAAPQKRNNPHDCAGHLDAATFLRPGAPSFAGFDQHQRLLAEPAAAFNISLEDSAVGPASDASLRSPPARAVISALRI